VLLRIELKHRKCQLLQRRTVAGVRTGQYSGAGLAHWNSNLSVEGIPSICNVLSPTQSLQVLETCHSFPLLHCCHPFFHTGLILSYAGHPFHFWQSLSRAPAFPTGSQLILLFNYPNKHFLHQTTPKWSGLCLKVSLARIAHVIPVRLSQGVREDGSNPPVPLLSFLSGGLLTHHTHLNPLVFWLGFGWPRMARPCWFEV